MVKKVRDVSENPLTRFEVNDDADPAGEQMETRLLENSIAEDLQATRGRFRRGGVRDHRENMSGGRSIR